MHWIECSDSLETTVIGNTVTIIIVNSTQYKQDPQNIHMKERWDLFWKLLGRLPHAADN